MSCVYTLQALFRVFCELEAARTTAGAENSCAVVRGKVVLPPQRTRPFFAVLARNKLRLIEFSHFGLEKGHAWFLHSSLELVFFFSRSYVFVILDKTMNKNPQNALVTSVGTRELIKR